MFGVSGAYMLPGDPLFPAQAAIFSEKRSWSLPT
jgi:hypothetical protein